MRRGGVSAVGGMPGSFPSVRRQVLRAEWLAAQVDSTQRWLLTASGIGAEPFRRWRISDVFLPSQVTWPFRGLGYPDWSPIRMWWTSFGTLRLIGMYTS